MAAYGPEDIETTLPLPVIGDDDGPAPRLRLRRFLYRATLAIVSIVACLLLGFGVLLALTPSAGQATAIAARIAARHHVGYPGPQPPPNFSRPLIATEDHRYYSATEVGGLDPFALATAARDVITGHPARNGATIEVQLAKMLYIGANSPRHDTMRGELEEAMLAVKLDATYSKAEILRLYAEVAYYGNGYYGLQQASCGYFGHPAAALSVTQGALLAGAVNAPDADDPVTHPAQARARLTHVINRMTAVGYLTPQQASAALNAPLNLTPGHSPDC